MTTETEKGLSYTTRNFMRMLQYYSHVRKTEIDKKNNVNVFIKFLSS